MRCLVQTHKALKQGRKWNMGRKKQPLEFSAKIYVENRECYMGANPKGKRIRNESGQYESDFDTSFWEG